MTPTSRSPSEQTIETSLADWVACASNTSAADEGIARALLLDSLGVMESGSRSSVAQKLMAATNDDAGMSSPAPARRVPSSALAVQRGTAGAAELWDDTSLRMLTHPSVPILAALLAEATHLKQTLGEFLSSFTVGLEVQLAVAGATSDGMYQRGFHATGVLGSIGAAGAVARARRMDARGARAAMGVAASLGSGLRVQFGSDAMPLHSGFAASHGVQAAQLGGRGITADPQWLTGRHGFAATFAGQERVGTWDGPLGLSHADIVVKQYPVGAPNVAPVNAALQLMDQWPHQPEEIVEVRCHVHKWVLNTVKLDPPDVASGGRVSLPYCVSAAISLGDNLSEAFLGDGRISKELHTLSGKVHVEVSDVLDDAGRPTAKIEVLTQSRQRLSAIAHDAYILPELDAANGARLRMKFRRNWRRPNAEAVERFVVEADLKESVDRLLDLIPYPQNGTPS